MLTLRRLDGGPPFGLGAVMKTYALVMNIPAGGTEVSTQADLRMFRPYKLYTDFELDINSRLLYSQRLPFFEKGLVLTLESR